MEKVIVVVGPTGVGKTRMGVALAKHFNGEVISGDSMQIYKTMDIGTAKVTDDEMEGIVHHLIDVKEPTESYSVKDFQDEVRLKIKEIISRGKLPIIVGGTGLYIKAALYDYEFIKVDGLNKPIVSDGTVVTYYYKNKNDLIFDITDKYLDQQLQDLLTWTEDASKDTSMHRLIKYVLQRDVETANLRLHLFSDSAAGNEQLRKRLLQRYKDFASILTEKISERTSEIPPDYLSWLLLILSDGLFIHKTIGNTMVDIDSFIANSEKYLELIAK